MPLTFFADTEMLSVAVEYTELEIYSIKFQKSDIHVDDCYNNQVTI